MKTWKFEVRFSYCYRMAPLKLLVDHKLRKMVEDSIYFGSVEEKFMMLQWEIHDVTMVVTWI